MQFKKWQNNKYKEIAEQIHKLGSETDLASMLILKERERKMLLSQAGDQQSLGSFCWTQISTDLFPFVT